MKNFSKVFLATISLSVLTFAKIVFAQTSSTSTQTSFEKFIANLLGMIMVPLFLMVGFSLAIQLTSVIFKPVIGGAKKALKLGKGIGKVGLGAGKIGVGITGGLAAGVAGGIASAGAGAARGAKEGRGFLGKLGGGITGGAKGVLTTRGRAEGKQAMKDAARKIPFVATWQRRHSKSGVPPTAAQKKQGEKGQPLPSQYLAGLPNNELKKVAQQKAFSKTALYEQKTAMDILGQRKAFDFDKPTSEKIVGQAQALGYDVSKIAESRPDLAPLFNKEKMKELIKSGKSREEAETTIIQEAVRKMDPKQFRSNVNPRALEDLNVLLGMDESKITHLGATGSTMQNQALVENFLRNESIFGKIKTPNSRRIISSIRTNPNFKTAEIKLRQEKTEQDRLRKQRIREQKEEIIQQKRGMENLGKEIERLGKVARKTKEERDKFKGDTGLGAGAKF